MRTSISYLVTLAMLLAVPSSRAGLADLGGELIDPGMVDPVVLELSADGAPRVIGLSTEVEIDGIVYGAIEVSVHGWARLLSDVRSNDVAAAGAAVPAESDAIAGGVVARSVVAGAVGDTTEDVAAPGSAPSVRFDVFHTVLDSGPKSRVLYYEAPGYVVLRWNGYRVRPALEPAVFDLMLDPSGHVRYQYYVLPERDAGFAKVGYRDASGRTIPLQPAVKPSFQPGADRGLRSGDAIEFLAVTVSEADLAAAELAGGSGSSLVDCRSCATEIGWCQQARAVAAGCTSYVDSRTCASARAAGFSCCTDTVNRSPPWHFRENAFCLGCSYTFYVLVECGTEMHLPLDDMEGGRVRVTEFLSGQPVPVTCQNQQFYVPGFHLVNCDRAPTGPGPEDSYYDAPAYRKDNASDPTAFVEWGFGDTTPCQTVASVTSCASWAPGAGTISVSPGEQQLMDCFVADTQGLCGLYRVDILSGGFDWYLYANCDGLRTPNFQVFDSCTDACAAYSPRPELTASNLENTATCPGGQIEFDLTNIGCTAAADIEYRIESDCPVPDVHDGVLAGTLDANTTARIQVPFHISCQPARVTVTVDPRNTISNECSESPGAAKCLDIPGVDSVFSDLCVCDANLSPRAGAPTDLCEGATVTLDGGASTGNNCTGAIEYRWLDDLTATELCGWSTTPVCVPPGQPFVPGTTVYRLEQRCASQAFCTVADTTSVTIYESPRANAGLDAMTCLGGLGVVLGGDAITPTATGGSGVYTYAWDPPDYLVASSVPNPLMSPAIDGVFDYQVTVTDFITGCTAQDSVQVTVAPTLTATAGSVSLVCYDGANLITLGGLPTASGGVPPYDYQWTILSGAVVAELSALDVADPVYAPLAANDPAGAVFQIEVRDSIGCVTSAQVTVVVARPPLADAGPDRSLCAELTTFLGSVPTGTCLQDPGGVCLYEWTPPNGLFCTDCSNPEAQPSVDRTYTVTVTDATSGCSAVDQVTVTLDGGLPGIPADIGNQVRAVKSGRDALLSWTTMDPVTAAFNVRRGERKTDFLNLLDVIVAPGAFGSPWIDIDAVPAPPAQRFYLYRVQGLSCGGNQGPY